MNKNYDIGDLVEVRVEKIVPRGFGIAFAEGLTILVALAAPGDELTVRIVEIKKRLAFAEIVSINTPSAERQQPPCPYFGECGGCDFQQLKYESQIAAKVGIIRDSLQRIGKINYEAEISVVRSPPLEYRSRVRWQVDSDEQKFGYYKRHSHEVIDVEHCPKITPEMNAMMRGLRANIDYASLIADHAQIAAISGSDGVSVHSSEADERPTAVRWSSGQDSYTFSADTFFQANKFLVPQLIDAAVGGATGSVAFDLYSGVGLFTLPLARNFEKVLAVEEHAASSSLCRQNIDDAGIENAIALTRDVRSFLKQNRTPDVDLVVLDPPRAGTEKGVIKLLAELRPRAISYVSCDPSILARDLRDLLAAGYSIVSLTALDLFPQTHHVETVARLTRRS